MKKRVYRYDMDNPRPRQDTNILNIKFVIVR